MKCYQRTEDTFCDRRLTPLRDTESYRVDRRVCSMGWRHRLHYCFHVGAWNSSGKAFPSMLSECRFGRSNPLAASTEPKALSVMTCFWYTMVERIVGFPGVYRLITMEWSIVLPEGQAPQQLPPLLRRLPSWQFDSPVLQVTFPRMLLCWRPIV